MDTTVNMNLNPDYSWAPDSLGHIVGSIEGVCLILAVIALCAGVARWLFSRTTRARWDDAIGDRIIVSVLIGSILMGGLAEAAAWGLGVWGSTGVNVAASTSATSGQVASVPSQSSSEASTQNFSDAGDHFGNSWDSVTQGDVGGAIREGASGVGSALSSVGNGLKGVFQHVQENGIGQSVKDAGGWAWDKISGAWRWVTGHP